MPYFYYTLKCSSKRYTWTSMGSWVIHVLYILCVSLRCWRCVYLSITCLLQISGSVFTFNIYTPISNTTIYIMCVS